MSSEHQQWENIRDSYLKSIQKNLAQVDHPRRTDILNNVREHLDNKYAELYPEQKNWEGFQQIITEMGPPEEYAELLAEDHNGQAKHSFGINEILAIVFVIVLAAVGSYLVYNAKTNPSQQPVIQETIIKNAEFELDERVLGKWTSVDFVKMIDDFDPAKKSWQGKLYLEGLDLQDKGVAWWLIKDKKYKHHWTKGKVNPFSERPAYYYLRSINGKDYLFFEWISGDVTIRGEKPHFYVLKKVNSQIDFSTPKCKVTFGESFCNADYVRSILGSPCRIEMNGRKLCYDHQGFNLIFSTAGPLSEVHLNQGYKGQLDTGISLNSKMQDIFNTYGQPFRRTQASDLHRKNEERVLFQKDNTARIYYGDQGLIFWFRDENVIQIVPFEGTLWLE